MNISPNFNQILMQSGHYIAQFTANLAEFEVGEGCFNKCSKEEKYE